MSNKVEAIVRIWKPDSIEVSTSILQAREIWKLQVDGNFGPEMFKQG